MKRLEACLKGKVVAAKATIREKKVKSAIEAAKINLEDAKQDAEIKLEELAESLATCSNVTDIIQAMSDEFGNKETAKEGLKRLKSIEDYLKEDIKVEESK